MSRLCHYCGQELPEHRLGIRMTPLEGRIFDLILRGGPDGMMTRDICDIVFDGMSTEQARKTLRVHVCNINAKLISTEYWINGYGPLYRLKKRGQQALGRKRKK
jgi:hypothetical protein